MTDSTAQADNAEIKTDAPQAEAPAADPVAAAQREAAEYKDKLLRTLAEMENLRRRTEREVTDARLYGIASFARDVLAVVDNMHRALEVIGLTADELQAVRWTNAARLFPPNSFPRCDAA